MPVELELFMRSCGFETANIIISSLNSRAYVALGHHKYNDHVRCVGLHVGSGGASPLFVAGQSQVISRTRKGSQHIYYTGNVLRVLTFQILFIVSKTSKFRTCLTVIRNCTVVKHTSVFLHTYAIKLIL